jgi:hypothetical protein
VAGALALLGNIPLPDASGTTPTVVRIQRTNDLPVSNAAKLLSDLLEKAVLVEENDIVSPKLPRAFRNLTQLGSIPGCEAGWYTTRSLLT